MSSMKETIKQVAIDLFFQKGYFATSISEIARGCDIRKASIYYHYNGKEVLLLDIMQTTMQDLLSSLQAGLEAAEQILHGGLHDVQQQHLLAVVMVIDAGLADIAAPGDFADAGGKIPFLKKQVDGHLLDRLFHGTHGALSFQSKWRQ